MHNLPVVIDFSANHGVARILTTKNDVIVVRINYRTGPLGFFGSKNLGIQDQINAINWIHNYIAYFGGDRNSLTVFGIGQSGFFADLVAQSSNIPKLGFQIKNIATIDGIALSPWLTSVEYQRFLYRKTIETIETFGFEEIDIRTLSLDELSHIFSQVEQSLGPHRKVLNLSLLKI